MLTCPTWELRPADLGEIGSWQYVAWVLFTSRRPCWVPVLTLHTQSLVGGCACVSLCASHACMTLQKSICIAQGVFEGLCVHTWECAGVHWFVSLCLCICISVLFALNYRPLHTCCGDLRSQKVLSGLALCLRWVVLPLWTWHGCRSGIWVVSTQRSQDKQWNTKQRWICLLAVPFPALFFSLGFFCRLIPFLPFTVKTLVSFLTTGLAHSEVAGWNTLDFCDYNNHCANISFLRLGRENSGGSRGLRVNKNAEPSVCRKSSEQYFIFQLRNPDNSSIGGTTVFNCSLLQCSRNSVVLQNYVLRKFLHSEATYIESGSLSIHPSFCT